MPQLIAVRLRQLATFPHSATVDDDVVLVLPPLDLDGSALRVSCSDSDRDACGLVGEGRV
jgi:hypothetical protein